VGKNKRPDAIVRTALSTPLQNFDHLTAYRIHQSGALVKREFRRVFITRPGRV
jgi:hypothetical protein